MAADTFSFVVSHVRIEVRCTLPEALASLRAVWGSCQQAYVPTTAHASWSIDRSRDELSVHGPWGSVQRTREPLDVFPLFEAELYEALPGWHRDLVLLHAACVADERGRGFLLLGRSGAGKSSLARAAIRRGLRYFGDELAVTDGTRVWGVPRAVQFDPVADGEPRPAWLGGDVDLSAYRLRMQGERVGSLPLFRPPLSTLATAALDAAELAVIEIERSARTELHGVPALLSLAALHAAAYRPPGLDLGRLLRSGRQCRLRWADPEAAIDALLALVL